MLGGRLCAKVADGVLLGEEAPSRWVCGLALAGDSPSSERAEEGWL